MRASSWNQTSIGVPAVQESSASLSRPVKFFKSLLGRCIFLRMQRTRLQPGQAQLVQPFADRAFMHRHGKAARHFGPQVNAPPAHNLVHIRIRPFDDQCTQFRHLRAGQGARTAGTHLRLQSVNARVVVAANPVAQCLPVHAVLRRRVTTRPAFQDASQRQEPANLSRVLALARKQAKSACRATHPRDRQ